MIGNTPVADPGEWPGERRPPPPYFWTKLRPEGPKKNLGGGPVFPLSKGLDDPPSPPLSQGLDPALHTVLFSPSGRDILCLSRT